MRKFFQILFFVDLSFLIYTLLFQTSIFLLNSQIALLSSLFVILGSFYGYKRSVQKRVKNFDGKDIIDKMEDPYHFEEEMIEDAKKLFEEEKAKIKKMGLKESLKLAPAFFSPYRLFGYLFLIVMIFFLIRRGIFDPLSFLIGLAIVPFTAFLYALIGRD